MKMEEKIKRIQQRQSECDHLGTYSPFGMISYEDKIRQVLIVISSTMCDKCGYQFYNQEETSIRIKVEDMGTVTKELEKEVKKNLEKERDNEKN
jgi:hypothetical protein